MAAVLMDCPHCQSSENIRFGVRVGKQRYRCNACKRAFTDNRAMPGRRVPPEIVGAALSAFFEGMSYRDINRHLQSLHGVSPDPSMIYKWVLEYTDRGHKIIEGVKAFTGGSKWVVDETMLKIDGGNLWVWNVMDARSRFLLATHVSKTRTVKDAEELFQKALDAATDRPTEIVTDGMLAYPYAIDNVFGKKQRHTVTEGIYARKNNNLSERLQGTLKERTKVMRGLETPETAGRFLDGFALYYNYLKPHTAIGKTPASAAKIVAPFKNWVEIAHLTKATVTDPAAREVYADKVFKRRQQLGGVPVVTQKQLDGSFRKRRNAYQP